MNIVDKLSGRTCGEISCDECNAQREAAAARIRELECENARLREALLASADFLRDLRGEWKWKDGAGVRNSRDFGELCKCIKTVDSLLPNNSGQTDAPKS